VARVRFLGGFAEGNLPYRLGEHLQVWFGSSDCSDRDVPACRGPASRFCPYVAADEPSIGSASALGERRISDLDVAVMSEQFGLGFLEARQIVRMECYLVLVAEIRKPALIVSP